MLIFIVLEFIFLFLPPIFDKNSINTQFICTININHKHCTNLLIYNRLILFNNTKELWNHKIINSHYKPIVHDTDQTMVIKNPSTITLKNKQNETQPFQDMKETKSTLHESDTTYQKRENRRLSRPNYAESSEEEESSDNNTLSESSSNENVDQEDSSALDETDSDLADQFDSSLSFSKDDEKMLETIASNESSFSTSSSSESDDCTDSDFKPGQPIRDVDSKKTFGRFKHAHPQQYYKQNGEIPAPLRMMLKSIGKPNSVALSTESSRKDTSPLKRKRTRQISQQDSSDSLIDVDTYYETHFSSPSTKRVRASNPAVSKDSLPSHLHNLSSCSKDPNFEAVKEIFNHKVTLSPNMPKSMQEKLTKGKKVLLAQLDPLGDPILPKIPTPRNTTKLAIPTPPASCSSPGKIHENDCKQMLLAPATPSNSNVQMRFRTRSRSNSQSSVAEGFPSSPLAYSESRLDTPPNSSPLRHTSDQSKSRSVSAEKPCKDTFFSEEITSKRQSQLSKPAYPLSGKVGQSTSSFENFPPVASQLAHSFESKNLSTSSTPISIQSPDNAGSKSFSKAQKNHQTMLNFGSTPKNVTCVECGMSYCPVNPADAALHNKFHSRSSMGREWSKNWGTTVWTGELSHNFDQVENNHANHSHDSSSHGLNNETDDAEHSPVFKSHENKNVAQSIPSSLFPKIRTKDRIVKISVSSKAAEKRAVQDLVDCVNTLLSAAPENPTWKIGPAGSAAVYVFVTARDPFALQRERSKTPDEESGNVQKSTSEESTHMSKRHLSHPKSSSPLSTSFKAVAILLVERIEHAHHMDNSTGLVLSTPTILSPNSSCSLPLPKIPAIMGVSRIYTTKNYRRLGIAARLLDTACADFVYGYTIPKSLTAWSQPSQSGGLLAQSWYGGDVLESFRKYKRIVDAELSAVFSKYAQKAPDNEKHSIGQRIKVVDNDYGVVPKDEGKNMVLVYLENDALSAISTKKIKKTRK